MMLEVVHNDDLRDPHREYPDAPIVLDDDLPDVSGHILTAVQDDFDDDSTPRTFRYEERAHHDTYESGLRNYCTGLPRYTYLQARRATLADQLEMDHLLKMHIAEVIFGVEPLPLNHVVLIILGKFLNGAKPIADMTIFENLTIAKSTMDVEGYKVLDALRFVGKYCEQLILVNKRELGNAAHDKDCWDSVVDLVPQVKTIIVTTENHI